MHSLIIQISTEPVNEFNEFYEGNIDYDNYSRYDIDYIGDRVSEKEVLDALESTLPKSMFSINREKMTITLKSSRTYYAEWADRLRKYVNGTPAMEMKQYELRDLADDYGSGIQYFFTGWAEYPQYLKNFIDDVLGYFSSGCAKTKRTLYIGTGYDYHY